jgi:serine-type D-Ala-D-Ala carboxypeptidase (penicillin-binding protein 5/6)
MQRPTGDSRMTHRMLRGARAAWARTLLAAVLLLGVAAPAPGVVRPSDTVGDITVADLPADVVTKAPDLNAAAGVLMSADGRILWARQPHDERAMASTTKIMTAIVALENAGLDEPIVISQRAATIGESAARLKRGGTYPLGTLLEAMLVKSGNDASVAVAEHIGGSVDGFAAMMNEKAEQLGLEQTSFANPHGLDAPGHYSSANDLATLARYAMANEDFRRMVALEELVIDGEDGLQELENSNLLIGTLEGATGVKTGWTSRAGYCLVGSAKRHGVELFAVVLGATDEMDRFQQAGLLLEWGFVHYTEQKLAETGEILAVLPVRDYLDVTVDAVVGVPATLPVFDLAGEVTRTVSVPDSVAAPISRGDRLGTLSLVQGERLIAQVPLIAVTDIRRPTLPERMWIALVRTWRSLFSGPLEAEPAS